jgi:hypothetical protein
MCVFGAVQIFHLIKACIVVPLYFHGVQCIVETFHMQFIGIYKLCTVVLHTVLLETSETGSTSHCDQPQMIDDGDCGAIGGKKIGKGNRSNRRKPALAPLCPQIPHVPPRWKAGD